MLLPVNLWAQTVIGFEDALVQVKPGDMGWVVEQIPPHRWEVDSLNPISGLNSLHHSYDNPKAGCDYYILHHHPFKGDSLSLSFSISHAYPPSSGNNWQVAILADFDGELKEGIVMGVNLVGNDDMLRLWRVRKGEIEELGLSDLNYQEDHGRDAASLFRLTWQRGGLLALGYAGDSASEMQEICSFFLEDLPGGRSLVLRYEYSAAQDRKLWFDDLLLKGNFEADTLPPLVTGNLFESSKILIVKFNEPVYCCKTSDMLLWYSDPLDDQEVKRIIKTDSLSLEGQSLRLYLADAPPNRVPMQLSLHGICDRDGNPTPDTLLPVMRNESQWGDLVINEVMADPDPPLKESLGEYVELYNRSEFQLNLEGWTMHIGERSYPLAETRNEKLLAPGDYLVLYSLFLPNQGSTLSLYNREGSLIHAAAYRPPYKASQWKKDGGWSLESPDPELLCNTSILWEYSLDRSGGTPGKKNSVYGVRNDNQPPLFLYFGYGSDGNLILHFSERIDFDDHQPEKLILYPGNYKPLGLFAGEPLGKNIYCRFALDPSLLTRFSIKIPALSDCKGNLSRDLQFYGGKTLEPAKGSVLINEIMYDPEEGQAEYIELYNPGQYFVDIAELGVDVSGVNEKLEDLEPLSDHSRIMGPGEYIVLTGSTSHLMDSYQLELSGSWVELENFPSLPKGGGRIWLSDRSGRIIDAVSYGDEMHMDLISDSKGISLERISSGELGDDPTNWHSAASIAGYATPGRLNSQSLSESDAGKGLSLNPGVFSPDNDGFNDLLVISPGNMDPGCVIRLWVSRPDGSMVRMLANNHVASASSQYSWDGRMDDGRMAEGGFYVVHFIGYNPVSGARWRQKRAVGLVLLMIH